jgi:hypothetical protein
VGLALLGTVFGQRLSEELPTQLVAAGVPSQFVSQFGGGNTAGAEKLIVVGQDLGTTILAGVPEQFRALVEPLIPNIVAGIHQAFTLAVTSVFLVGVGTTILAFLAALAMKEIPLRSTMGPGPKPAHDPSKAELRAEAGSPARQTPVPLPE